MLKFVYDVPKNSTGTTLIAFPSLNEASGTLHQPRYHTRQSERLSLSTHGSISSGTSFLPSSSSSSSNNGRYCRRRVVEPYPLPPIVNAHSQEYGGVYANQNSAKVKYRKIWTQWFCHRTSEQLDYPPNPPADLQLINNVLFVHVNTDLEASIRAQMDNQDSTVPPALLRCLTIWIWKEQFNAWRIIDFGDTEMFDDGSLLALSLGGKSGIEPRWVLCETLAKKGFKKGTLKKRLI
ncbi:hypothetical protein EV360DRAFT_76899 [Lentinula raphanica]|nr:hypothetical protein EV360DRAFT_76899 [Lentinula raphanica]